MDTLRSFWVVAGMSAGCVEDLSKDLGQTRLTGERGIDRFPHQMPSLPMDSRTMFYQLRPLTPEHHQSILETCLDRSPGLANLPPGSPARQGPLPPSHPPSPASRHPTHLSKDLVALLFRFFLRDPPAVPGPLARNPLLCSPPLRASPQDPVDLLSHVGPWAHRRHGGPCGPCGPLRRGEKSISLYATMRWFLPRCLILQIAITGDQVLTSAERPLAAQWRPAHFASIPLLSE